MQCRSYLYCYDFFFWKKKTVRRRRRGICKHTWWFWMNRLGTKIGREGPFHFSFANWRIRPVPYPIQAGLAPKQKGPSSPTTSVSLHMPTYVWDAMAVAHGPPSTETEMLGLFCFCELLSLCSDSSVSVSYSLSLTHNSIKFSSIWAGLEFWAYQSSTKALLGKQYGCYGPYVFSPIYGLISVALR